MDKHTAKLTLSEQQQLNSPQSTHDAYLDRLFRPSNDLNDNQLGNLSQAGSEHDTYMFAAGTGNEFVDGSSTAHWIDTIMLEGISQGPGEHGPGSWDVKIDGSDALPAVNGNALDFGHHVSGTITLDTGETLTFTNIDKIEWS